MSDGAAVQGAVDAAGQAPPSRDVAAAERELEVMKQKVEAAEADVKEAKAEMKEAKKKVAAAEVQLKHAQDAVKEAIVAGPNSAASQILPEELESRKWVLKQSEEELARRNVELDRCIAELAAQRTTLDKLIDLQREARFERLQSQAPAGTVGAGLIPTTKIDTLRWNTAMLSLDEPVGNIQLPDGILWPNLNSSTLFVRSIYYPVFHDILGDLDPARLELLYTASKSVKQPFKRFIICGNPGIGKSSFGLFALFSSIRRGSTVVYCAGKLGLGYVFEGGRVYEFTWDGSGRDGTAIKISTPAVRRLTDDPRTVFICDGVMPPVVDAATLLITSPKKEVWHEFEKSDDCQMLYFPMFSKEEVLACRASCFPSLDEEAVLSRYTRWGGVPRYVLGKVQGSDQKKLEDAVPSVTLDKLRQYVVSEKVTTEDNFTHRLLHLKIRGEDEEGLSSSQLEYYTAVRGELASAYISNMVHTHLERSGQENLRAFIWDSYGIPTLAVLSGQLFEAEALKRFAEGGHFFVRNLASETVTWSSFSPSSVITFKNLEELKRNLGSNGKFIHVPTSKSFCAIDAVLPGRIPANMTLNRQHRICLEGKQKPGLVGVAESLGYGDQKVPFYWVVPDDIFKQFRARSFTGSDGKVVRNHPFALRVDQYALRIDKGGNVAGSTGSGVHDGSRDVTANSALGLANQKVNQTNFLFQPEIAADAAPAARFLGGVATKDLVSLLGSGGRALQSLARRLR